jgi:hypothetical protein
MAQADSVPSSCRQLITGETASQSTNLPAINQRAVRVQPDDCQHISRGSDPRVVMGADGAPLSLWRKRRKRGDEPEDLLKSCRYGAAGPAPIGSDIEALFYATAVFFQRLPRWIVLILLPFVRRNKHLRISAFDKVSSNQLVHQSHRRISGGHSGRTKSSEIESFSEYQESPPLLHRRLGRPDHHGR